MRKWPAPFAMREVVSLVLAIAVIHLILIQPNHPRAMSWDALRLFPLELPLALLLLVAAPIGMRLAVRLAVAGLLALVPLVKLADFAAYSAYGRGFNLVLDAHLLPAAWGLASGAVGTAPAAASLVALVALWVALAALVWWATGRVAAVSPPPAARGVFAAAAIPAAGLVALDLEAPRLEFELPGAAFTTRIVSGHAAKVAATRADLRRFRAEAAADPLLDLAPDRLLGKLAGRDVLVIFVESYGRSTLENPRYADTIRSRLKEVEAALGQAGLAMRSAYLTSPIAGGQSWLAHSTFLAGLKVDGQPRYHALVASPRRTLLHAAQAAGWETVAVMPAITLAWPEAGYFGYERILAADDLGYRGKPFNWVTMPDQFTLRALERLALEPRPRRPVFAAVALISSHAPWTPVPRLVDWAAIGDGRVFDAMAEAGDPPEVVWRDRDRVRDQFRQAVDYSLAVIGAFAARHAEDPPLIVVVGDHQPAGFVSEDPDEFDVPVHLIGPPDVLGAVEHWGWAPGLLPATGGPSWPMAAFRDRFVAAFTPGPGGLAEGTLPEPPPR